MLGRRQKTLPEDTNIFRRGDSEICNATLLRSRFVGNGSTGRPNRGGFSNYKLGKFIYTRSFMPKPLSHGSPKRNQKHFHICHTVGLEVDPVLSSRLSRQ